MQDRNQVHKTLKYMAFGFATFYTQHLELGKFATPDHAGSSIRSLKDRIDSFQSIEGFTVTSPSGNSRIFNSWDLKKELQRAISDLNMNEWGLDYENYKPSHVCNQRNRFLDLE